MNICVYGASSTKTSESFISAVESFGKEAAKRGHGLVFGGGAEGLMGAAARGFTAGGGSIIGVAPSFFKVDGVLYDKCTEFIYTETMRERKQILEDKSDAFVVTPGGVGTFDEFFEIITLKQLGRHSKPIVIFNIDGYFDHLQKLMENALVENMLTSKSLELYKMSNDSSAILDYLENYVPKTVELKDTKHIRG